MQARRQGMTGPLGEFVDHWFDAMNIFFFPLGIWVAFPVVPLWIGIFTISMCILGDWAVFSKTLKTKTMYFWYFSTDESITVYWLFLFSLNVTGYNFWKNPLPLIGLPPVTCILLIIGASLTILVVHDVRVAGKAALKGLLSEIGILAPIVLWIVRAENLQYPRMLFLLGFLAMGFIGTRYVGDLLRLRLTGLKYQIWYPDLIAFSALTLLVTLASFWCKLPLPLFAAPLALLFGVNLVMLCVQFCIMIRRVRDKLGIGLFVVPQKADGK
jgi:phosphatidylglycerophosphate synthase